MLTAPQGHSLQVSKKEHSLHLQKAGLCMEDTPWTLYKRNMNLPIQMKAKRLRKNYVCSQTLNFLRMLNDINIMKIIRPHNLTLGYYCIAFPKVTSCAV